MLFSPSCREFNSLQKGYTTLLHRTDTFSENKIIRSVVGGKVDGVKFYLVPGVRNQKFYLMPGVRNEKIYLVPNDSYEKFYLAVKGLIKASHYNVIRYICYYKISRLKRATKPLILKRKGSIVYTDKQ